MADHVFINLAFDPGRFECAHCGEVYTPALPCRIDMYLDMMHSFERCHETCELRTEGRLGPAQTPKERGVNDSD